MPCLRCGKPNGGAGFCEQHAHLSKYATKPKPVAKPSAHRRGYDAAWQKLRRIVLSEGDQCHYCGQHADTVDHVIPISVDPTLRLERSNLVPACKACNTARSNQRHTQ